MGPRHRVSVSLTSVILALAFAASRAGAQSYGLGDQVLTLGPAAFQPFDSGTTFRVGSDRYLYGTTGNENVYAASLQLPDGALIFQMCVYANVVDAAHPVSVSLNESRLVAGGQTPQWGEIQTVTDDVAIGYGTVCGQRDWVIRGQDGDNNVAYDLLVRSPGTVPGFGGVRIFWRRQVSLAPASPTFGDVPADAFGYQQIEALVSSGITGGCGGGNYCPDQPVTRAQMAVFLAKALGLHWPN